MILKGVLNILYNKMTPHILFLDILADYFFVNSPDIAHLLQIFFMALRAYAQDRFIYCEWCWSKIYKKNTLKFHDEWCCIGVGPVHIKNNRDLRQRKNAIITVRKSARLSNKLFSKMKY